MLFAITDIETTGSFAAGNSITEIAVCLHDGQKVIREFQSLVNPRVPIPLFIKTLTGITDEMLEDAPTFEDIADELESIFSEAIFVAHNVNFDYSFIKAEMEALGKSWHPKRLCTIRFARKAIPGLRSYGLGNLCRELDIINTAPHRAMGDTRATVELFERSLQATSEEELIRMITRGNGDAFLPNHINAEDFDRLPEKPGVYYFFDQSGKPIYIGKAKNIKKRVRSHFRDAKGKQRLQQFLTEIHRIDFQLTGNELIALLLEDAEIRKHWPKYNNAQKKKANKFAVFEYFDQNGFLRLGVNKVSLSISSVKTFTTLHTAQHWLKKLGEENDLDLRMLGFPRTIDAPFPQPEDHNLRLSQAMNAFKNAEGSFVLHSRGRSNEENAFVLIRGGELKGYGYTPQDFNIQSIEELSNWLQPIPPSETNTSIVKSFIENPREMKIIKLENA